ncbi:MAG: hypothetical protein WCG87_04945 [Bacteroidota bacterium]
MDVLNDSLLKFWKCLNEHDVQYIMIGGFAIRFHGFNRSTDDLDMWIEDTTANRKKLRAAFKELEYGDLPMLETMDFIPGWTNFHIGEGMELDILTEMKGLENTSFKQCKEQASIAEIAGIRIPFLHINQLIENKKATNRPKDRIDVIELEKILQLRGSK